MNREPREVMPAKLKLLHAAVRVYRSVPFVGLKTIVRSVWERHQQRHRGRIVIATLDDLRFELHLDELIDNAIYYQGNFEPDSTAAIEKLCHPGYRVLDIGANIGCHTLRFAKIAGPHGKVMAFEPMPWARKKLIRNLSLNDFSNTVVIADGLSDGEAVVTTHFRSSWRLGADERAGEAAESVAPVEVHLRRLDDVVSESGIDRIDLVKLDVDGYEFRVLRGAHATLTRYRPRILLEVGHDSLEQVGDSLAEMLQFLVERGYRAYRERGFTPFSSMEELLAAIPERATINVVMSTTPLPA